MRKGEGVARTIKQIEKPRFDCLPEGTEAHRFVSRALWLKDREIDVTASVAACLFGDGLHPYLTAFQLWANKSGLLSEDDIGDRPQVDFGRRVEPILVDMLRDRFPTWRIALNQDYFRNPMTRVGATPDTVAIRPDIAGIGTIQLKSVGDWAFKQHWLSPDRVVESPLFVSIQAAIETIVTGATWTMVAVFERNSCLFEVLEIPPMPQKAIDKLYRLVREFWRRVEQNDPYPIDWSKDVATVLQLNRDADDDYQKDLSKIPEIEQLVADHELLKRIEKTGREAKDAREIVDGKITQLLGNAASGRLSDGTIINAPVTRRKATVIEPFDFRAVRVKRPSDKTASAPAEFPERF